MLENILIKYFNLTEDWNEDFENKEEIWNESYNKLIDLIYKLDELGVLPNNNRIVDKLDEIHNEEQE